MRLAIKVVPGSSRNCIAGWLGDSLKVRVKAPPEGGNANRAAAKLIAEAVGTRPEMVSVIRGGTSPRKIVEIVGLSDAEARSRLEKCIS
jgi:uncharacterized protein (TIGR00251 family)